MTLMLFLLFLYLYNDLKSINHHKNNTLCFKLADNNFVQKYFYFVFSCKNLFLGIKITSHNPL